MQNITLIFKKYTHSILRINVALKFRLDWIVALSFDYEINKAFNIYLIG